MARVDKTESAIGVTRGTLKADIPQASWGKPLGVGIGSDGLVVVGAAQTGIVGVIIADKTNYRAGSRCDIFGNGSEILLEPAEVLAAGSAVTANTTSGVLSNTAASGTQVRVGFTVETDRIVVTL